MAVTTLDLRVLPGIPLVQPGDNLGEVIASSLQQADMQLQPGDILVIAQKIISKAEDCYVFLDEVEVSADARRWAGKVDKDPALVELILRESREVVRYRPGAMIVEHRQGFVHANAGIDRSNIDVHEGRERVLLLPEDANASARSLQQSLQSRLSLSQLGIIVSDSAGRAWREGITGFAIGSAAVPPLVDHVGSRDLFDRELEVTTTGDIDELASAASLLMGQGSQGHPVVRVRGWEWQPVDEDASALIRAPENDLFR